MKKTWSLSTTVRSPERILPFLKVLKEIEGENFDKIGQEKFQMLLIQNRLYKPTGLNSTQLGYYETLEDKMKITEAEEIFGTMVERSKELQKDRGLRGRTSVAPLTKMGLAVAKKSTGQVEITELGNAFLENKIDIGYVYFRFFIKWQIPNLDSADYKLEDGYDIKPFIGVLHLISAVNEKSKESGEKEKGISKEEFSLFCPTLINYRKIESYSKKIIALRTDLKSKTKQEQRIIWDKYKKAFAREFLGTNKTTEIQKLLQNLKDYGDNAIRYIRLTRYIHIRGGGFYIDLEPRRSVEINALLDFDNAQSKVFSSKEEYLGYISNISKPILPWETKEKLNEIIKQLLEDIKIYTTETRQKPKSFPDHREFDNDNLKKFINDLRNYRRELQDHENHRKSQNTEQIKEYIENLENIFKADDRPVLLEKLSTLGLNALNDAIKIQPNYPVGDDNEPTFTAPANTPDIECFYQSFNAICEVTMLTGRDQWYNEGQPVMRHLRDFENKHNDKTTYCLFIAPQMHRDTINTFWTAIKYEYEGNKQRIIPLSINNFVSLLKVLVQIKSKNKFLKHSEIARLYDEIINSSNSFSDSDGWLRNIPTAISSWQKSLNF
ncbi:hypothetical protein A2592_01745 [Candidatus Kaiserbacteria bacterium RIFOXYD1_FULL_42_15]|uniref:Restriction endonuclease n=1 Tax=Candidatus Kaiserbacteria bacterium RIFOXYD1_FULL_42_15 TaxID=1798532 RepID=A0A1F6FPZ5_9BACT|nr:MAG: hypothetical protein A2592_01745 [Candidatus Kaiserbacteria bacterium RIFOXYD1_FULL_42_15]